MNRLRIAGRIMRGALGTSLVWAVGWAPIGAAIGAYELWAPPTHRRAIGLGSPVLDGAVAWASGGALCGFAFAIALALSIRKKDVRLLTARRAASLAGTAATVLVTLAVVTLGDHSEVGASVIAIAALAALAALFGAVTVALARRPKAGADSGAPAT